MTVRVHHLNAAVLRGMTVRGHPMVCRVLVLETERDGLVLVDTGLGTADYANIAARMGRGFAFGYARPVVDPALAVVRQIEDAGFGRHDVRHIVLTHLDLDHCGGMSDFPRARVHVHIRELDAARRRRGPRAKGRYRPALWAHDPLFRPLSTTVDAPWFGFAAARPPEFPDEVVVVALPGHTAGHCGVAVATADGWTLHAGDAYYDDREVRGDTRSYAPTVALFPRLVAVDDRRRRHSRDRLRELVTTRPEVTVVNSHAPDTHPISPGA